MKALSPLFASSFDSRSATFFSSALTLMARSMRVRSWAKSVIGFVRKSSAPSFIAATARSISPKAVMRIAPMEGYFAFAALMSSTPFITGIL